MKIKKILFTSILFIWASVCLIAQSKTVCVIATGGTIAGSAASSVESGYKPGVISVEQLLKSVPDISKVAKLKSEQFSQIGSQDITIDNWIKLANRINELAKDKNIDAFVITHGTDTQDETSYFLNLTLKTSKPVILVGSMRPSTGISPDGPKNLYNAIACAASDESVGKGVMVVMDDMILGADDLEKTHTLRVGTYANPNYGPLGIMYDGKPIYSRTSLKKHTVNSEFDISNLRELPRVDIFYGYAGVDDEYIKMAIKNKKVKGIVFAGVGNGNMSAPVLKTLTEAPKKGKAVVRSSRLPMGPTSQWDEVDDDALNFSTSWFLTPQKARILLMLALTKTNDYKEIQRMFTEY